MKVVCAYNKLKELVESGERIVSRNLTLPILNNLLLEAQKNSLIISATNLEIGIRGEFPCKVIQEGAVSVPAKIIRGIISNLAEEKIELETKKTNTLTIKAGSYKGELKGQPADDFPIIPTIKNKDSFRIAAEELAKALSQTIPFTSVSETRPEITGVFLTKGKGDETVRVVATDSFRLAERMIFLKNKDKEQSFSVILPQKTAAELLHLLSGESEIDISIEKNQVAFSLPSKELISRLIDGAYPNYEGFVPKEFASEVTADRDELIKTIRLVSLLSSRINDICLRAEQKEGILRVSAHDPDLGENEATLKVEQSGETIEVHFNWHYLLEGLQQIEGKKVTLKFSSETKPALLRSVGKSNYLYIVMPIRV